LNQIIEALKTTIDETPPELISDLMANGIALAGGGALLGGIAERLTQELRMRVYVAHDPLTAVVRGAGIVLEELDTLHKIISAPRRPIRR
jgi:rod shape-determining protein MreB